METQAGADGASAGSVRPWEAEYASIKGRGRVAIAAFSLGILGGVAILAPLLLPEAIACWVYLFLLVCFHMSEYLLTAAFRPDILSFDNFLLNHSLSYQLMVLASFFEYWVEFLVLTPRCGWCKGFGFVGWLGLGVCLIGMLTRIAAMATAGSNFSHTIEWARRDEHRLVTTGIYTVLRHPAYFGFFWWSVGTQLLLCNPVCLLAYAAASFSFFLERIPYEEQLLLGFFGSEYRKYRERTWIGIPFLACAIRQRR